MFIKYSDFHQVHQFSWTGWLRKRPWRIVNTSSVCRWKERIQHTYTRPNLSDNVREYDNTRGRDGRGIKFKAKCSLQHASSSLCIRHDLVCTYVRFTMWTLVSGHNRTVCSAVINLNDLRTTINVLFFFFLKTLVGNTMRIL